MDFVPDGHCLWKCGAIPTRAGIISIGGSGGGSATVSDEVAHSGAYALHLQSYYYRRSLPTPRAGIYSAQWLYPYETEWGIDNVRVEFRANDSTLIDIRYDGVYWDAYINDIKVADGNVATSPATWQQLACYIVIGDAGSITTYVDGILDISYAGDTKPGAESAIDQLGFQAPWLRSFRVDDWVFGTGGWPGDYGVEFIPVISDVSASWIPSAGSDNYALVDERPPSDDDYVSTTADATDIYGMADWDNDLGAKAPLMVTGIVRVKKSDPGSDDKITLGFGDGVNTADGSAVSVLTSYEYRWHSTNTAPDGGAWTDDDVDNLQLRVIGDIV